MLLGAHGPVSTPVRILFAEDSPEDVELLLDVLRKGGFEPERLVADSAEGMRQALAGSRWDLVIADPSMPRFDALSALTVLEESGQDVPVIVISDHFGEDLAVACMRAGAHDYVTKDDLARLVPAVERELREAGRRRERREALLALRAAEERYRLLVENAADVVAVTDRGGRVTFASPSVGRVLGFSPEEIVGRTFLEFVHPEDETLVSTALDEVLSRGSTPLITGLRVRHREGGWRILEGSAARLTEPDGTTSVVTSGRDITERVQLEAQLNQSQKMEAVGRLAGGVAHDFNNLLTVILGYSNLLLEQLADNRLLYQEVEEVKRAADRAASLTQKLLAFSRKQVLSLRPVDLDAVVEGMADMLRRLIGEDIELEMRLEPGLGRTKVDPGQIEQVIMNLAVNARDAMPEGGTLSLSTANLELDPVEARMRAVQPGPYVMLDVTDTGVGMDEVTQARLFEPFFTTKEPGKGTGLGLSTVYGIVKQSGGSIYVYSEPGHGTSFKVYLPRGDGSGESASGPAAGSGASRGDEMIVLVEDEPMVRSLVSEVLRGNGYQVLEFSNGREALARLKHHAGRIHGLVTDVVMPGMSGIELVRQLAPSRPDLRVLFLSGYTDELVTRQGMLQPGRGFLQKPFTPDTLLRKVREILDVGERAQNQSAAPGARQG